MSLKGTISKSKIDKCVRKLTEPIVKQIDEIIKERCEYVTKIGKSLFPQEVLDFQEKYPELIKSQGCMYIKLRDDSTIFLYSINCPDLRQEGEDKLRNILLSNDEHHQYLNDISKEINKLEQDKITFKNQLRCTLESLKTFTKVKDEFPEAYDIFVDMENKPDENLCDDIENVRAKLNSKLKSISEDDGNKR